MNRVLTINDARFRQNQVQVNVLANEAIHNILKLIDPASLSQKKTEEGEKGMSGYSWRYIYYLGFWKKLYYLMDTHSSLGL